MQMPHRPARRRNRRLARSVAREPGAQHARDHALGIGDGGEQCRPGLARGILAGAVEALRVEPQRLEAAHVPDPPAAEVGLGDGAVNWLGGGEQPACGLGRPSRDWRVTPRRNCLRQAQEAARLLGDVAETVEPADAGDQVQEIAVLSAREIDPLAGHTARAVHEPHHETAPRRVLDVADAPGRPFAPAVGEVLAAHGFRVLCQAARKIGGGLPHGDLQMKMGPPVERAQGWSGSVTRLRRPVTVRTGRLPWLRSTAARCGA